MDELAADIYINTRNGVEDEPMVRPIVPVSSSGVDEGSQTKTTSGPWRIETLNSFGEIQNNAYRWQELETSCTDPQTPFQSFAWCSSWCDVYARTRPGTVEPQVFLIFKGDILVALLPLMVETHMGARVLTVLGEPHSQIANILVRDGYDCSDGLNLCLQQVALVAHADVIAIGPIPQDSVLLTAMHGDALSADPAEYLSLHDRLKDDAPTDLLASMSKNRRKDFNRKRRLLEARGKVTFDVINASDPAFSDTVQRALDLKRDWLKRENIFSLGLTRDGVDEFLAQLPRTATGFQAELEILKLNDDVVAITINLVGKGLRHCYLTAYDMAYFECSPGTQILVSSLLNAAQNGETAYSFLGYPTPFKAMWTNDTIGLLRYQQALTVKGKVWLYAWTRGLRPFAKKLVSALRAGSPLPILGQLGALTTKLLSTLGRKR